MCLLSGSVVFGTLEHILLSLLCYGIQVWSLDSSDFHDRWARGLIGVSMEERDNDETYWQSS